MNVSTRNLDLSYLDILLDELCLNLTMVQLMIGGRERSRDKDHAGAIRPYFALSEDSFSNLKTD